MSNRGVGNTLNMICYADILFDAFCYCLCSVVLFGCTFSSLMKKGETGDGKEKDSTTATIAMGVFSLVFGICAVALYSFRNSEGVCAYSFLSRFGGGGGGGGIGPLPFLEFFR